MTNYTPREMMEKARTELVLEYPFYACGAMHRLYAEDQRVETMATDGKIIWWNPEFVKTLSLAEVIFVLCHEVLHVLFAHHARMGYRNPEVWNLAGDLVINLILHQAGFKMPEGAIYDDQYDGWNVEAVYGELIRLIKTCPRCGQMGSDSQSGQDQSGQDQSGQGQSGQDQSGQGQSGQGQSGQDQSGQGQSGQGQSGQGQCPVCGGCGIPKYKDWKNWGEIKPFKDGKASPSERAQEIQERLVETVGYSNLAKSHGSLPASLASYIGELGKPTIRWEERVANFIAHKVKSDYTWQTPNKRYIRTGAYLPSLEKPEIKGIYVACDSSGSVDMGDTVRLMSEVQGLLSAYNIEIPLIWCDTQVQHVQMITQDDIPLDKHLQRHGNGGTSFYPVFDYIDRDELDEECQCLIYLTDGECDDTPQEPDYPVLWVLTTERSLKNGYFKADFGEVVVLD